MALLAETRTIVETFRDSVLALNTALHGTSEAIVPAALDKRVGELSVKCEHILTGLADEEKARVMLEQRLDTVTTAHGKLREYVKTKVKPHIDGVDPEEL